jgi:hypothetical protein
MKKNNNKSKKKVIIFSFGLKYAFFSGDGQMELGFFFFHITLHPPLLLSLGFGSSMRANPSSGTNCLSG